jgi:hypothetical protein
MELTPEVEPLKYTPRYEAPETSIEVPKVTYVEGKYDKLLLAPRTNLLIPGLNVGVEIPVMDHWSVGVDYYFPWLVSAGNKWCFETLALFVDAKYWFGNDDLMWMAGSKLKGHAVGVYAGVGLYDFQNAKKGQQGEFIDFGVDYTYAMPIANNKLRLEFNIGLGFLKTWYRPYTPSSDYSDLIKEPGVKYRVTNFVSPTMAGVSLVWPINVPAKVNPYFKMLERKDRAAQKAAQRTAHKTTINNNRAGGDK